MAEPTPARKTVATIAVLALVCVVWWVIEDRSKAPPPPDVSLPYPPLTQPPAQPGK